MLVAALAVVGGFGVVVLVVERGSSLLVEAVPMCFGIAEAVVADWLPFLVIGEAQESDSRSSGLSDSHRN